LSALKAEEVFNMFSLRYLKAKLATGILDGYNSKLIRLLSM